jgi:hypothetical protein
MGQCVRQFGRCDATDQRQLLKTTPLKESKYHIRIRRPLALPGFVIAVPFEPQLPDRHGRVEDAIRRIVDEFFHTATKASDIGGQPKSYMGVQ